MIKAVLETGKECENLNLRPLKHTDINDIFEYSSNENTCKYLRWGPHNSIEETKKFLEKVLNGYDNPSDIIWGVEENKSKKIIGLIRIYHLLDDTAYLSYVLNENYINKGYMTEAVKGAINICFETLDFNVVNAYYIDENKASLKVMLNCGMEKRLETRKMIKIKDFETHLNECMIRKDSHL